MAKSKEDQCIPGERRARSRWLRELQAYQALRGSRNLRGIGTIISRNCRSRTGIK